MNHPIFPGAILSNRYSVVRQLGHGGFGRTYLAQDNYRFKELCVLKEFAPRLQGAYALQKAEELFDREAKTLNKLQHPQIPKLRESFRLEIEGNQYLFIAQEYVNGKTYRELIDTRKLQGSLFSESEVIDFLKSLLPVLDYIHSFGVIHRDISPDNIILGHVNPHQGEHYKIPFLIDFGGVKQIAAELESQIFNSTAGVPLQATKLGKQGYAPEEQMRMGIIYPNSDIYALAATTLVLLTGEEPSKLINHYDLTWNWHKKCHVSPDFSKILAQMLAAKPGDRYQSAKDVINALTNLPKIPDKTAPITNNSVTKDPPEYIQPSPVILPIIPESSPKSMTNTQPKHRKSLINFPSTQLIILLTFLIMATTGGLGWLIGKNWVKYNQQMTIKSDLSKAQKKQDDMIHDRCVELEINCDFYLRLVDEIFYTKYAELEGRPLTDDATDQRWRRRWLEQANTLLDKLDLISLESRRKIGNYTLDDITQRQNDVNLMYLSSRALNDLTDAKFFYLFPEQPRDENILDHLMGQVWQAISEDKLAEIKSKKIFSEIEFDKGKTRKIVKDELKPGEGRVYISRLTKGQKADLELNASQSATWLSIYPPAEENQPNDPLMEDANKTNWEQILERTGYYEFVVVSTAKRSNISYRMRLNVK